MRLATGVMTKVAHESITSKLLIQQGINNPDFLPTIMRLYPEDSPLIGYLDQKGNKTKDLNYFTNDGNYRTVGSNHIQYLLDSYSDEKIYFRANASGVTFKSDAYPTMPGYKGTAFYIYIDSNWPGYQEVIELSDTNRTQLHVQKDVTESSNGTFEVKVKIIGDLDDYVNVDLMSENSEGLCVMNLHEQDFSKRGTEKYKFDGFGDAYLSLQRFKYSWSGTARAMKQTEGYWAMHNGQYTFIEKASFEMMKMAAKYAEYQIMWGKGTVSQSTKKVTLYNDEGREVLAGRGIMNSGEGPIRIPTYGWSKKFLIDLLTQLDAYTGMDNEGKREIVALMSPKNSLMFSTFMKETYGATMNNNIEGFGSEKGVNDTYAYYELDGIRIVPKRYRGLDSRFRASQQLPNGEFKGDYESIFLPMGLTQGMGMPKVQLVQLRPMAKGTVAGIDQGGNIADSIDGSSTHMLFQIGVVSQIQPFMTYRP